MSLQATDYIIGAIGDRSMEYVDMVQNTAGVANYPGKTMQVLRTNLILKVSLEPSPLVVHDLSYISKFLI